MRCQILPPSCEPYSASGRDSGFAQGAPEAVKKRTSRRLMLGYLRWVDRACAAPRRGSWRLQIDSGAVRPCGLRLDFEKPARRRLGRARRGNHRRRAGKALDREEPRDRVGRSEASKPAGPGAAGWILRYHRRRCTFVAILGFFILWAEFRPAGGLPCRRGFFPSPGQ